MLKHDIIISFARRGDQMDIAMNLANELKLNFAHVKNVIDMLDEGNTVPFISRYRKERTGAMDDQTVRLIAEKLERLRALEKRKNTILQTLSIQGVLTDALTTKLESAASLAEIEDLYRPYRPKRKTRASDAAEKGLTPLAELLMDKSLKESPESCAKRYLSNEKGVATVQEALSGARDIVAEVMSSDPRCRGVLRSAYARTGMLLSVASNDEDSPYTSYYGHCESVSRIPDHRILAINRGEREGFLKVSLSMEADTARSTLYRHFIQQGSMAADQLQMAADDAWSRLIEPSLQREIRSMLTERASAAAVEVFGKNLHQLLMQPPVKGYVTLGIDPGFRTGCKLAVVDAMGAVLETGVAYFTLPGENGRKEEAKSILRRMIRSHGVTAIAIGNGTASRESEAFIAQMLPEFPGVQYAIVSEAGASVYSASKLGAEEFPDYDVTIRSAISIARRLQDPLAELVKIDPKSIGVGQYQHDLKESELNRKLDGVVEDCVNAVGVELSTASAALLSRVAGIGPALAKNIVAYREEHGFSSRAELKKVPKLGPRAFEQAAGFLRLADSKNYLDSTAVHPESYPAAKALIEQLGFVLADLKKGRAADIRLAAQREGVKELAEKLSVGEPTLRDILDELVKPGRDPRDDLPPTILRSDVLDMKDLKKGMKLMGTVRNVIDFGAFVDIGVHQDGLVHVSRMAKRFVRHPSEIVKVGDVIDVWVLEVDIKKKRISLSMTEDAT